MKKSSVKFLSAILLCMIGLLALPQTRHDTDLQIIISKGIHFGSLSQFDSSFIYYDSAFALALKIDDRLSQAYINKLKGTEYIYLSVHDSALAYLNQAKDYGEKYHNDTMMIISYLNIGYILHRQGNSDSAEAVYLKCLEVSESIGFTTGEAKAYNLLNILYKGTGEYVKGLETAIKSLTLFKNLNNRRGYISSLISLANMYEKLNKDDSAYSCYELAYTLSLEHDDPGNELIARFNMAVLEVAKAGLFMEKGEQDSAMLCYKKAKHTFEQVVEISQRMSDEITLAESYNNLANIHTSLAEYDMAIGYAEKALTVSIQTGDAILETESLKILGISYLQLGDEQTAQNYFKRCLEKANSISDNETAMIVSKYLSAIAERSLDYKEGLEFFKRYTDYKDSIFNIEKEKLIREYESDFEIQKLKDAKKIASLENEKLLIARNISQRIGGLIILLLIVVFFIFWLRAKKNRIIAQQRIRELENEKKLMRARSVLIGQENERKRIAHDLHDGIGVLLSTASLKFSKIKVDLKDKETAELFDKATKLINEAGGEVRKISRNMMPGVLSKLGLRDALEELFESVSDIEGIETNLTMNCEKERLPENTEIMIYRIVQELVNNTIKHARASEITFEINKYPNKVHIKYADNGIGFNIQEIKNNDGMGLSGISSRVDFLNGKLNILSSKGNGCHYEIDIPISS